MELSMYTLLSIAKAHHASDLHITVGVRPKCRISGTLYEMDGFEKLTPAMTKELVESMFGPKQKATMEATGEVDFAYTDTRVGRFRVNAFHQRGSYAAVLRIVASDIPTPEALGIPEAVLGLTKKKRGLVLVTGPTGSGKSTTLASLIDVINKERNEHIITLEDPIEYLHGNCFFDRRIFLTGQRGRCFCGGKFQYCKTVSCSGYHYWTDHCCHGNFTSGDCGFRCCSNPA